MADDFSTEMAAAYVIEIEPGKVRKDMERLDNVIRSLRAGRYSQVASNTVAASLGGTDLFVTRYDEIEGRVVSIAEKAMIAGMDFGKDLQAQALQRAVTAKGLSGKPGGRNGPGRDVDGDMIDAITRGVEILQVSGGHTAITGFHGWKTEGRRYFTYQEKGTAGRNAVSAKAQRKGHKQSGNGGVPAANSLGVAIIPVREYLRREIQKVKK